MQSLCRFRHHDFQCLDGSAKGITLVYSCGGWNSATVVRVNYARTVELKGELVREQRLTTEARRTFRAYTSWSPESLAVNGYTAEGMVGGRRAVVYRAPDATTLMAESFAATHCFSLVKGTGRHTGSIGLAFEPFDRKSFRVDIRGTFWIEQATSRLQLIDSATWDFHRS